MALTDDTEGERGGGVQTAGAHQAGELSQGKKNMPTQEIAIFEPSLGDRIRVAVKYGGAFRPIFWLQIGKDGSVYLGHRYREITELKMVSKKVEGGEVRFKYDEGEPITDPRLLKSKVSYHASGIINMAGRRHQSASLRTIQEQTQLCIVSFRHPSQFAAIQMVKDRDICLDYPLDEQRPLWGILLAAPAGKARTVNVKGSIYQLNMILPFSGLEGTQDLHLQFVLSHGPEGPWPPYNVLAFETEKVNQEERI